MVIVADIFSLLAGIAGWYYMFYSRAAQKLQRIEAGRLNALRIRLRRTNGFVMLLLAGCFFAACHRTDPGEARSFAILFLAVLVLLAVIVSLALVDIRLTWKLRKDLKEVRS